MSQWRIPLWTQPTFTAWWDGFGKAMDVLKSLLSGPVKR
jgi:hypothetical protein